MPGRPADENVVNVAIRVPTDLHEQAKRAAANEDLSLSQLVRRLLREHLTVTPSM